MSNVDVIRAWKDEDYRRSLTPEQLASLPANPAGMVELDEPSLDMSVGGATELIWSIGCCGGVTHYESCGVTCGHTCWGYTVCGAVCSHLVCP